MQFLPPRRRGGVRSKIWLNRIKSTVDTIRIKLRTPSHASMNAALFFASWNGRQIWIFARDRGGWALYRQILPRPCLQNQIGFLPESKRVISGIGICQGLMIVQAPILGGCKKLAYSSCQSEKISSSSSKGLVISRDGSWDQRLAMQTPDRG